MTTLTLNIKDDSKVEDVLRFLRDIDFLEVSEKKPSQDREFSLRSLFGSLNRFANSDRVNEEAGAWYEAAREKHDSH
jgi:hypothetical protein